MSYIDKDATLAAIASKAKEELADANHYFLEGVQLAVDVVEEMAEPKEAENGSMPCPDARNSHDRTTDDCISRQAVIDAYGDWYVEEGTEEGFIGTVKQLLEGFPSAQPEIIRCKDCMWYGRADKRRFYRGMDCLQHRIDTIVPDKDFCSRAERRIE